MKKRIRTGQYSFPNPEWKSVSQDAKDLIKGMLITDPSDRFSIYDVMRNKWIVVSHIVFIEKGFKVKLYITMIGENDYDVNN